MLILFVMFYEIRTYLKVQFRKLEQRLLEVRWTMDFPDAAL